MSTFNWFGALENDVCEMFASNSYSAAAVLADLGGDTVIDPVLNRISREVSETFTPESYQRLVQRVHGEIIIFSAIGGETTGTMTLSPVKTGTVHCWRSGGARTDEMVVGEDEYRLFSVSGQIVTPSTAMVLTEYLYASYVINTEDPTFAMTSVADKVVLGAAAELGERLYLDKSQPWPLVDTIKAKWAEWKSNAMENLWVPEEMRRMLFWNPIDRGSQAAGSVRWGRG
jgi:hypothetical protein